jgi:hypothetical protein
VDKALVNKAVEHANLVTAQQASIPTSSSVKPSLTEDDNDGDMINIKTRLGSDVRDWSLSASGQCSKVSDFSVYSVFNHNSAPMTVETTVGYTLQSQCISDQYRI